jgi:asparagine synthase (glutamine-hydrolysing)
MCGIAGIVDLERRPIDSALLLSMSRSIAHRGPDDEGYVLIDEAGAGFKNYCGETSPSEIQEQMPLLAEGDGTIQGANIGLAQRRFSIIDLSAGGHQPMFDRQRSCCIVFNGEIYNYLELRDQLAAQGVAFYTNSDTEVLLEAYKAWGPDCFSRLNGFWALALYDFRQKRLIFSRDRIGKKPLYWTRVESRLYFASEIKALLKIPEVNARKAVHEESIYSWLMFGRKDLNFTTCFEGIYSFPSAAWAYVQEDFPRPMRTFWRLPEERFDESELRTAEVITDLRELLEDSVRIRLRADVPLSVELSGGLDSSTLVAVAAKLTNRKITTYTVRFPEKESNEEPFARSVAERYQTDYHVLESPISNFWSQILPFTYLEEEPYHSPNQQTNQVIWAQMRREDIKVSLSGAGGDEDFAGYGQYLVPFQAENLIRGRFGAYTSHALKYSASRTHLKTFLYPVLRILKGSFRKVSGSKGRRRQDYYTGKQFSIGQMDPLTLTEALYNDMTNTLMPYWLRSSERAYMGLPLEVRAPLLDYRLVEFAFRLPLSYLIRDGWQKWILRKAVEDILPNDVVWRRQKLGFPFPYPRFFKLNRKIVDLILSRSRNPYLDFSRASKFSTHWNTLSFILWYELFFNDNRGLFEEIQSIARAQHAVEDYGFRPMFLDAVIS